MWCAGVLGRTFVKLRDNLWLNRTHYCYIIVKTINTEQAVMIWTVTRCSQVWCLLCFRYITPVTSLLVSRTHHVDIQTWLHSTEAAEAGVSTKSQILLMAAPATALDIICLEFRTKFSVYQPTASIRCETSYQLVSAANTTENFQNYVCTVLHSIFWHEKSIRYEYLEPNLPKDTR